ncbi:YeiH family protein [Terasakiella sp.]|uniref:YeiH family protein n=1 Tax=Terasakiella sp. TaxID=2034861 RepID=UPI003AA8F3FF
MERIGNFYRDRFSGLLVALTIAIAAVFLSDHYGAPTMLFALLLGIAFNFLSEHERCAQGIDMAAKQVLRIGVALLGLRISFAALQDLGLIPVVLVIAGVVTTIFLGIGLTRLFTKKTAFGCLTGGAVAICGASAAMALSSVLPQGKDGERDTIFTVVTVTAFSTMAMVIYPIIAAALGLNEQQTGVFLGATIHDVAQVVGAGYGVSDHTGDVATVVKLLRVAMLLPVVLIVMMAARAHLKADKTSEAKLPFPWFVLGFVALVILNSSVDIPVVISSTLIDVSRWCIVMAVAALGMKTSFAALVKVGWMPLVLMLVETLYLAGLALIVITFWMV